MARRATFVKQVRTEAEHVLLLDAGDSLWSDRPLCVKSHWRLPMAAMNALGYDAAVLGSLDLRLGKEVLQPRLDEATFPVLSANVRLAASGDLFTAPYTVRDIGGHRIAILGLTDVPAEPGLSPDFEVTDPVEAASKLVPELAQEADIVIVLSHAGPAVTARLEEALPQIDLIVAGGYGKTAARPSLSQDRPPVLVAERPSPGHAGRLVGRADLRFDGGGQLLDLQWQAVALTPDWADDPEMQALVARFAAEQ